MYKNLRFEIRIGESPKSLINRYGVKVQSLTKNQAAYGMAWYSMDWPNFDGHLFIENGNHDLELTDVGTVQGTYDSRDYASEGISHYYIAMGLPTSLPGAGSTIPHQAARTTFYALLRRIRAAGWERYIPAYAPRLSGAETFTYQASGMGSVASQYSMDALEMPTFEQWMALDDGSAWQFYKNGVYMRIKIYRDSKRIDPNKPGDYFITIDLTSRDEYQRQAFESDERSRWKELYPNVRKKRLARRAAIEAELVTKGYTIDTHYKDPDEQARR